MSKASEKQLGELHGVIATEMSNIIKEGVKVVNKEGAVVSITPPASYFKEIREFLKDNNITSTLDSKPVKDLVDSLPTFEDSPSLVSAFKHH